MEILIEFGDFAESAVVSAGDGFGVKEAQLHLYSRDAPGSS